MLLALGRTYHDPSWRAGSPLALVVMSAKVSEGTFSEGRILLEIARNHRLAAAQTSTVEEFTSVAERVRQSHGPVDLLILAGHGNPFVGPVFGPDQAVFTLLQKTLSSNATVVIAACSTGGWTSTGKSFALQMRENLPGRTIVAASDLTNAVYLRCLDDQKGPSRYRVFMSGTALMEEPPKLTLPVRIRARVGTAFAFKPRSANNPTRYSATGLPPGLRINPRTGWISGKPSKMGTFKALIFAANSGGETVRPILFPITGPKVL